MDIGGIIILILTVLIVGIVFGVAFVRTYHTSHRMGEGMFKSSEFNLDEKDDLSDKVYYDEEALK